MKKLLLSTAMLSTATLGAATVPALAQDQSIFREAPDAMELRASDFMGMRVYATETAVEGEELEGIQEGWEDVGEINDIVMNREGQVQAVLVDIGGFLGIGERSVAVSMDALQFVSDSATAEEADDFFLVMNASREALEAAPEYVTSQNEGMNAEQAAAETDAAIEEGEGVADADVGAAVEGVENVGEEVTTTTVEVIEGAEEAAEATGETVADAAGTVAEGTENVLEETGEEVAQAGAEVADEAADAGEEVTEEIAQTEMTDTQEDGAEVADATADATEEAAEETAEVEAETADETADQTEMAAEGTMTETEMAAEETAEAATATTTEEAASTETTDAATTTVTTEEPTEGQVEDAELTSTETTREPILREGFVAAGTQDFTADRLQGAAVFDANDERVGEVAEILLSEDGQVSNLVVDVGGFLGIGEKPVSLDLSSLDILRQDGGEEIRVYVSQTEEELEAMERYEAQ